MIDFSDVVGTFTVDWQKRAALRGIAVVLTEAGEIERALEIAGTFTDDEEKAMALSLIADALTEAGKIDRSQKSPEPLPTTEKKPRRWMGLLMP